MEGPTHPLRQLRLPARRVGAPRESGSQRGDREVAPEEAGAGRKEAMSQTHDDKSMPLAVVFNHVSVSRLELELNGRGRWDSGRGTLLEDSAGNRIRALPMTPEDLQALAEVDPRRLRQFLAEERRLRETPGSGGA